MPHEMCYETFRGGRRREGRVRIKLLCLSHASNPGTDVWDPRSSASIKVLAAVRIVLAYRRTVFWYGSVGRSQRILRNTEHHHSGSLNHYQTFYLEGELVNEGPLILRVRFPAHPPPPINQQYPLSPEALTRPVREPVAALS